MELWTRHIVCVSEDRLYTERFLYRGPTRSTSIRRELVRSGEGGGEVGCLDKEGVNTL